MTPAEFEAAERLARMSGKPSGQRTKGKGTARKKRAKRASFRAACQGKLQALALYNATGRRGPKPQPVTRAERRAWHLGHPAKAKRGPWQGLAAPEPGIMNRKTRRGLAAGGVPSIRAIK